MEGLDEIIAACKRNDREAQSRVYSWLAPSLMGLCIRYMQGREEAEDLLQDSFVKIFTSISTYRNEGSFEGWAKRITVNMALNELKKKKTLRFDPKMPEPEHEPGSEDELAGLTAEQLLSCLAELPHGYRTIINLFLVEEFSHREISEKLNISESTSRSQYSRALRAFKQALKKKYPLTLSDNIR